MDKWRIEKIAKEVIDCGFTVHKEIGPGLLESAYQSCLSYEINKRGLTLEIEKPLPLIYKEINLACGYRIDIVVENCVLLEIKSLESFAPVHTAQILTYLKLSNIQLGFLFNFNVPLFKNGIKRVVNNY